MTICSTAVDSSNHSNFHVAAGLTCCLSLTAVLWHLLNSVFSGARFESELGS